MSEKQTIKLPRIRSRGPLAEKVYAILKEAIITGKLGRGTWLQEEALTKALDVSRTPIREALNRLKSEGLVELSPRKGAHIIELTDAELEDLFEVRETVETIFFVRSAKKIPVDTIKRFHARLKACEKAMHEARGKEKEWEKHRREYLENDRSLHDALIEAAGNKYWQQIYYDIRDRIEIFGNQLSLDQQWFDRAIKDHYRILTAIEQGDFRTGKAAMRDHIRNVKNGIARIRNGGAARIEQ